MNKIRIGLIGCGKQAPKHISGLKSLKGVDVDIVVADINSELAKATAEKFGVSAVGSVDEVFCMPELDAVDICTPVTVHHELCLKALSAGKHVFCEKPLVTDSAQARELEALREQKKLIGMVGYIYRFAPAVSLYKELSSDQSFSESFGEPVIANFRIGGRGSHQLWKHQRAKGGGAINEMLVHMLDLAMWYFGKPVSVDVLSCDLLVNKRSIDGQLCDVDAEDSVIVQMKMQSGVVVNIQADMLTPSFTQFLEIQGQKGTFCGSIQPDYNSYIYLDKALGKYNAGMNPLNIQASNLFESQMGEFVNAVIDQNTSVSSTIQDSINLLDVMDQINKYRYEH